MINDPFMLKLEQQLIKHEGLRLKPYRDTVGKLTIGVGRNLDDKGISEGEARLLLDNDIANTIACLSSTLPWFQNMDDVRRRVLIDMAFNMGVTGLMGFKNMLAAVMVSNWGRASSEMLSSKWAKQVGRRAQTLAHMMQTGEDVNI